MIKLRGIHFPNFLFALIFISFFSFCKKSNIEEFEQGDFLIFGHFHGECIGEKCVETFKLTSTYLYEDENDYYSTNSFDFTELSKSKFEAVKDLPSSIPTQLINTPDSTFGCPDCLDQGGILIQLSQKGKTKTWRIDKSENNIPEYLHAFLITVNNKIALLSD